MKEIVSIRLFFVLCTLYYVVCTHSKLHFTVYTPHIVLAQREKCNVLRFHCRHQ